MDTNSEISDSHEGIVLRIPQFTMIERFLMSGGKPDMYDIIKQRQIKKTNQNYQWPQWFVWNS